MAFGRWTLTCLVAMVILSWGVGGLSSHPAGTASGAATGPRQVVSVYFAAPTTTTPATSHNWAGYVIASSKGSVTSVTAHWVVPAIQGSCPSATQWSAAWVGIDGWGGSTVEQTGTVSICSGGSAYYEAWYEFVPAKAFFSTVTISPGDHIVASVTFNPSGNVWTTSLADTTNSNSLGSIHNQKGLPRSTAEWIAEDPGIPKSSKLYPMSDFGTVTFRYADATISGHTHSIGGFANQEITMWNNANTAKKAVPNSLTFSGTTFSVTWKSSGP